MTKSLLDEFTETFEENVLPDSIASQFKLTAYLGSNSFSETFLLTDKESSKKYVLKRSSKNDTTPINVNEPEILKALSHPGIPKPIIDIDINDDEYTYTIREYLEGITLEEYLTTREIDESEAVSICIKICDILIYLHDRDEPVIHRDIKPSNIIINPHDGSIALIDFEICRIFHDDAETDTVNFGTRKFAPPEQYGFAQTDCRADIYAMGALLTYILTGSPDDVGKNGGGKASISLMRIAAKCLEIDRDKRYKSAAKLKQALLNYKSGSLKMVLTGTLFAAVIVCLVFFLIFNQLKNEPDITLETDADVTSGEEPLPEASITPPPIIEDTSYPDENNSVADISLPNEIMRLREFAESSEWNKYIFTEMGWELDDPDTWEGITWVNVGKGRRVQRIDFRDWGVAGALDLSGFIALEDLRVEKNYLTSINLEGLVSLRDLLIYDNQLTSLDLSELSSLVTTYFNNNRISEIDVSNSPALQTLGMGWTDITSVDLSNNPALILLECTDAKLTELDLSNNVNLHTVRCEGNQIEDISSFVNLPRLHSLNISRNRIDLNCPENIEIINKLQQTVDFNRPHPPEDWEDHIESRLFWETYFPNWVHSYDSGYHHAWWWNWDAIFGGFFYEPQQ